MTHFRRILSVVAGLFLIGGLGWLLYLGATKFASYVSTVPKELGAALIAGATTVVVATLTIVIGRYYERKKELDALYRDKKTEIYDEFLKKFFEVFHAEEERQTSETNDWCRFFGIS